MGSSTTLLRAAAWSLLFISLIGRAAGTEVVFLTVNPLGVPIGRSQLRAYGVTDLSVARVYGSETGEIRLDLTPGGYDIAILAPGFQTYWGTVSLGPESATIRIGLIPALDGTTNGLVVGRVVGSPPDGRRYWAALESVYGVEGPAPIEQNTEVRSDGTFAFSELRPGAYSILLFEERLGQPDQRNGLTPATQQLVDAQVIEVNGVTEVTLRPASATAAER